MSMKRLFSKMRYLLNWIKVMLPLRHIRYFPPHFVVRDPIAESVSSSFKRGFEVAVIVYMLENKHELIHKYGYNRKQMILKHLKTLFRETVSGSPWEKDIILVDYNYNEGFQIYVQIKQDENQNYISEIQSLMDYIYLKVNNDFQLKAMTNELQLDKGYMFIENSEEFLLQDAICIARHAALVMAEKRIQSEYKDLVYKMNQIILNKDIRLFGQPIINIETKEIKAWEMLTRGPEGTDLEMPLRLFSIARQSGSLYDLEMIVLEKALEKMIDTGCKQEIFVNCTPLTLANKRFIFDFKQLMQRFKKADFHKVVIEVTEQDMVEDKENLLKNIKMMRSLGFRFAVDDTGAGYSSFHTIGEIMPEIIKIDRAVIKDIHNNSVNESMLKGILLVAKEVGSRVVAEGIESEEEAKVLSVHNVDYGQGFYYARPAHFTKGILTS